MGVVLQTLELKGRSLDTSALFYRRTLLGESTAFYEFSNRQASWTSIFRGVSPKMSDAVTAIIKIFGMKHVRCKIGITRPLDEQVSLKSGTSSNIYQEQYYNL